MSTNILAWEIRSKRREVLPYHQQLVVTLNVDSFWLPGIHHSPTATISFHTSQFQRPVLDATLRESMKIITLRC